jgi:hypothetical protein
MAMKASSRETTQIPISRRVDGRLTYVLSLVREKGSGGAETARGGYKAELISLSTCNPNATVDHWLPR